MICCVPPGQSTLPQPALTPQSTHGSQPGLSPWTCANYCPDSSRQARYPTPVLSRIGTMHHGPFSALAGPFHSSAKRRVLGYSTQTPQLLLGQPWRECIRRSPGEHQHRTAASMLREAEKATNKPSGMPVTKDISFKFRQRVTIGPSNRGDAK